MRKVILFVGLVLLTCCTPTKYEKMLNIIDGDYRLVGYTINGIDSSASLNPKMDSIIYHIDAVEGKNSDPYRSSISIYAGSFSHGEKRCGLVPYPNGKTNDSFQINWELLHDWTHPEELNAGPFVVHWQYQPYFIRNENFNPFIRGTYKGKTYQYNLKKK